jgi:hypothetical protein
MKLSRPLLKAIENAKYSHPTPIQVWLDAKVFWKQVPSYLSDGGVLKWERMETHYSQHLKWWI